MCVKIATNVAFIWQIIEWKCGCHLPFTNYQTFPTSMFDAAHFQRCICSHSNTRISSFLQVFTLVFLAYNLWMHSAPHLLVLLHFESPPPWPPSPPRPQTPSRICSSSAYRLLVRPPSHPPSLPPSLPTCPHPPGSYVLWCRINISHPPLHKLCSQSLLLALLSLHPLWHSRRRRRTEALYARVQSRGAICSWGWGGWGGYGAATVRTSCLLSHFPLAPSHCDNADISGRLVNSRSDSGSEEIVGLTQRCWN